MRRICVFCGSSFGTAPDFRRAARQLGVLLARRGLGLVYGGGNVGLMGELANSCLEHGGDVIGVIPRSLADRELAHTGLPDLRVVESMHERKAVMADLADAFVALPGGLGTLEEFCEVLTWAQLGFHAKPCGLLSVAGYFDGLLAYLELKLTRFGGHPSIRVGGVHHGRAPSTVSGGVPPENAGAGSSGA